jgi:DNA-binding SARP family transcriptional activator
MTRVVIPVRGGTSLLIGLETTGLPHAPSDWELVRQAASVIGSWLVQGAAPAMDDRLDVYALGPLRAERRGVMLLNWGGPKAGTRQAEAIFAFLFDRGERGANKDEIIELIWPDVDLERADPAFHRTLGGLRRTLSPTECAQSGEVISFRNDRYHLNPELVRWSDIREFEDQLDAACTASEPEEVRQHLETARRLYRGDYLDDCPFYGDSSHVEARRQLFRGRHIDVLIALADAQEHRGNRSAAARFLREAVAGNGNQCTPAEQGLLRLEAVARRPTSARIGRQPRADLPPGRASVYLDEVTAAG